jgi:hypothetical protein
MRCVFSCLRADRSPSGVGTFTGPRRIPRAGRHFKTDLLTRSRSSPMMTSSLPPDSRWLRWLMDGRSRDNWEESDPPTAIVPAHYLQSSDGANWGRWGTVNATRQGGRGWSLRGADDGCCIAQIGQSLDIALRFLNPAKPSGSRKSVQGRLVGLQLG